jgi:lipoprotein-anchoring transpeptidase ErfK/SrfK
MKAVLALALAGALTVLSGAASAGVMARIDLSSQTMHVTVNGQHAYSWSVSTARRGYGTPTGSFRPTRLARYWRSTRYGGAPMPYSIFFHKGYAIHGTTEIRDLGRPASHGCIRLHPANAAILFSLVREYGTGNSRIQISW